MKTIENNALINEFVPYEVALAMKELGFNEPCLAFYWVINDNGIYSIPEFKLGKMNTLNKLNILVPLYSQCFKWFRKKYKLQCYPMLDTEDIYWCLFSDGIGSGYLMINGDYGYDFENLLEFESYEKAELACLNKLIEIIKAK